MSAQWVRIKDEQIEAMKNWLEPKSIREIQVLLGFANFYWRWIQSFSLIAGFLISMLQTSSPTRLSKNLQSSMGMAESEEVSDADGGDCEDGTIKRSLRSKNLNRAMGYLTPNARQTLT